jgi:hypothetical protein
VSTADDFARNRESRERLGAMVQRLDGRNAALEDGWNVAAVFAHLAFWDRVAATRIELYLREHQGMEFFNDVFFDYINAAGLPQWSRTPLRDATADALAAAQATDLGLERLTADEVALLEKLERPNLFRRFPHREGHLDQIERALR